VARLLETLDDLIGLLKRTGVQRVKLRVEVRTDLAPGTQQVTFRGQVTASAELGDGEVAEHVEQVMPYLSHAAEAHVPRQRGQALGLREFRRAVGRQLQTHRAEYRAVMDEACAKLSARLAAAGLTVIDEGQ
jgi:hypothetical protein